MFTSESSFALGLGMLLLPNVGAAINAVIITICGSDSSIVEVITGYKVSAVGASDVRANALWSEAVTMPAALVRLLTPHPMLPMTAST